MKVVSDRLRAWIKLTQTGIRQMAMAKTLMT